MHKNRRKYVRLESYFLLKHAIQWTAPPEYSSVSFQSYLLYFCTAAQFLCFCNGLFLLYSNERFLRFVPLMYFYAFVLQVLFLWCLSLRFRWTVPLFHQISNYCRSSLSGFSCVGCFYMNVSLLYVFIITASVYLSTYFSIKI